MTDIYKSISTIPKLNDTNWSQWKFNVQLALKGAKVWQFVDSAIPAGKTAPAEGSEDQKVTALQIIRFSMEADQMRHIGEEEDPRAAWTMLAKAKEARTGVE